MYVSLLSVLTTQQDVQLFRRYIIWHYSKLIKLWKMNIQHATLLLPVVVQGNTHKWHDLKAATGSF